MTSTFITFDGIFIVGDISHFSNFASVLFRMEKKLSTAHSLVVPTECSSKDSKAKTVVLSINRSISHTVIA